MGEQQRDWWFSGEGTGHHAQHHAACILHPEHTEPKPAGPQRLLISTFSLPPAAGIMVAVCSCYGRSLWSMCIGCCWHRPQRSKKKDEDAYVQIQALRQQLQDLQSKMSTETQ